MKILVTGGCGYIGSALTVYLKAIGHEVVTVDLLKGADLQSYYSDLAPADFRGFDAAIHLAAHSSVAAAAADPMTATRNNLTELINMLPKLGGIPLLWASSGSVLSPDGKAIYDATKRAAEAIVPTLYPNSYALRFGTVCGVSPHMRWDLMLNKMASDAITNGAVQVSNPWAARPVLAMRDLCDAVAALLQGNEPGAYNLVTHNDSVRGFATAVVRRFRCEFRDTPPIRPTYDFFMVPTPIVGFQSTQTVDTILQDLEAHMSDRA